MSAKGKCLCGRVQYTFTHRLSGLDVCHCKIRTVNVNQVLRLCHLWQYPW
jgi:hypothetical protein